MQNDRSMPPDSHVRCHLAWGRRGVRQAATRGDIIVVVDVLSFATTTVTAIAHGARIRPCTSYEDTELLARDSGAQVAVRRQQASATHPFTLSPLSFLGTAAGTQVLLPSPNGATCSRYGRNAPYLFVGALINARAVASLVDALLARSDLAATVVACGERWLDEDEDGPLRFAIEDLLGAGAILAHVTHFALSAEASLAATTFQAAQSDLFSFLWTCESGRELREGGFAEDVRFAAQLDHYQAVPILQNDWFVAADSQP